MTPEQLKAITNEMAPRDLAAQVVAAITEMGGPTTPQQAAIVEAASRFVAVVTGYRPEIPDQAHDARHRLVVISPDQDTDYCYVDLTREEALKRFWSNEDAHLYKGPELKVEESEFAGGFMLWRNMGNGLAKMMRANGFPPDLIGIVGNPDE
jgi:hypothetical protein